MEIGKVGMLNEPSSLEVGLGGRIVKLGGAGVAVYVLADVYEESALEVSEGLMGVFGIEVGP